MDISILKIDGFLSENDYKEIIEKTVNDSSRKERIKTLHEHYKLRNPNFLTSLLEHLRLYCFEEFTKLDEPDKKIANEIIWPTFLQELNKDKVENAKIQIQKIAFNTMLKAKNTANDILPRLKDVKYYSVPYITYYIDVLEFYVTEKEVVEIEKIEPLDVQVRIYLLRRLLELELLKKDKYGKVSQLTGVVLERSLALILGVSDPEKQLKSHLEFWELEYGKIDSVSIIRKRIEKLNQLIEELKLKDNQPLVKRIKGDINSFEIKRGELESAAEVEKLKKRENFQKKG